MLQKNNLVQPMLLVKLMMIKDDRAFVPYKVTAVAKRCPQNSSIQFDALMPFKVSDADAKNNDNWFNSFLNTFVVLNDKANMQTVEKQMQNFYVADAKQTFNEMLKNDGGDDEIPMGYLFFAALSRHALEHSNYLHTMV